MRFRRGFTLIEVLIAATVSLLVLGATYRLFVHGARLYARGQARAELQASGLVALDRMSRELRHSAASTLTVLPSQPGAATRVDGALSFRLPADLESVVAFSPSSSYIIYFRDRYRNTLVRKTSPASAPGRLDVDELERLCGTADEAEQLVATGVEAFLLGVATPDTVSLELQLGAELDSTTRVQETVNTSLCFRNRL
ncbi:MAG: prepilin-type N-terminal cleavage/methylation domain-containing protein [Armatimonadetes bacterium]|nr:prepilin-type N-terminal cleavage/methylation domain-containing protein [Armatimonadota bacterium]